MHELTLEQRQDLQECYFSPELFIQRHCKIYDSVETEWIPFALWPAQREAIRKIHEDRLVIILKARQIGLTWLCLTYALWQVLFRPIASVGLFSRRDTEALYLLGKDRLRGIYEHLPEWIKTGHVATADSGHEWGLSNGSAARAFPTSAGDSYVNTLAIVDEADLAPDLNHLMRAVKPTIDNGGKLILLSRVDKTQPMSEFKTIYRAAAEGLSPWTAVFLPWNVHPARDAAWYETQKSDILTRTLSLDDLHEQYPATDVEALAPRSLDKRIPHEWLHAAYAKVAPLQLADAPALPSLTVWAAPVKGRRYVIGADPAEGNPTSDESALCVLDKITGAQVAELAGRFDPSVLAGYAHQLGHWYNRAEIVPERNNHGHAFIAWFAQNSHLPVMAGPDNKPGWNSNSLGKTLMYDRAADTFRDAARDGLILLHGQETYLQLASIEGATLLAPEGMRDDRADAWTLANAGRLQPQPAAAFAQGSAKGWNP